MAVSQERIVVSFSTTKEIKSILEKKAGEEQRSVSNYLNTLIRRQKN